MHFRGKSIAGTAAILLGQMMFPTSGLGRLADVASEMAKAKQYAAKILKDQSNSLEMLMIQATGNAAPGALDADSGNSSRRDGTYHAYLMNYCLAWKDQDKQTCEKWLPPNVTTHTKDKSSLEGIARGLFDQKADVKSDTQVGYYDVVKKGEAPVIDEDGKMDLSAVANYKIQKDAHDKIEQVGYNAALKTISLTFDEEAKSKKDTRIAPDDKDLRQMSGRWTQMFLNHAETKQKQARAARKGTEFMLGEDVKDCNAYIMRVSQEEKASKDDERLNFQGPLGFETVGQSLEDRYKQCQFFMQAKSMQQNPQPDDNGNSEDETVDEKLYRAQAASIKYGGLSSGELSQIAATNLTPEQTSQTRGDWNSGSTQLTEVRENNSESMQGYNQAIDVAKAGMESVAARSENINNNSKEWDGFKLKKGIPLTRLNDLAPSQIEQLSGTDAPLGVGGNVGQVQRSPASEEAEGGGSSLTVTAAH